MKLTMTKSENKLYHIIKGYIEINQYSPCIRELCVLYGVNSPATIHYFLKNLKKKGIIDFQDGKSRTIVLR